MNDWTYRAPNAPSGNAAHAAGAGGRDDVVALCEKPRERELRHGDGGGGVAESAAAIKTLKKLGFAPTQLGEVLGWKQVSPYVCVRAARIRKAAGGGSPAARAA